MKNKIFLYLFLFAALYIIFQYTNSKKTFEEQDKRITELKEEIKTLETAKDSIKNTGSEDQTFTLLTDDKAKEYFEDQGVSVADIAAKVESEIIGRNKIDQDNELVPFTGMRGDFRINRIQILNHQWVLAEFTDSEYWGEVWINYYVGDDGSLTFETQDGFIYP